LLFKILLLKLSLQNIVTHSDGSIPDQVKLLPEHRNCCPKASKLLPEQSAAGKLLFLPGRLASPPELLRSL
jgi:hypothetical protein